MLIAYSCALAGVWLLVSNSPLPPGFSDARELQSAGLAMLLALLPSLPATLPNFMALMWIRGEPQKKRLVRVASIGWAGFAAGMLALASLGLSIQREGAGEDDLKFLVMLAIFPLAQAVLGISATKAYRFLLPDPAVTAPTAVARAVVTGLVSTILFTPALFISISMWRRCPLRDVTTPVGVLRTLNTAMVTYASTYGAGYPASLRALGPPSSGTPGCDAAGLIPEEMAKGELTGYIFHYTPGTPYAGKSASDCQPGVETYTLAARPARYGRCDKSSYFTDESGVIRSTDENRPPTAKDPPLY
jgi:hypothetical protein